MNLIAEYEPSHTNHSHSNKAGKKQTKTLAFTAMLHLCPNRVYTTQTLMANFCIPFLNSDPKRLSAGSNNLDLWRGKRIKYFTPSCL